MDYDVTLAGLLNESVNLDSLYARPSPWFRSGLATSYDRRSKSPSSPNWFANGDRGNYVRVDGDEYVLLDLNVAYFAMTETQSG